MLGESLSLATALVWACAVVLLRRSGDSLSPFELNLFRVGISSLLLLVVTALAGEPLLPARPAADYLLLAFSAVVGIVVSDTLFHHSLNLMGAGISAVVDCLYAPFVALAALAVLGERLGTWQLVGMALVVGGVLVTTRAVPPPGSTRRDLLAGIAWGVLAMATLAVGLVAAKPVLARAPVVWVVTFRQLVSLAVLLGATLVSARRRPALAVFRPRRDWRFALPAAVLGSFVALLLWLAGMKHAAAGVAAVLNQTSTVFVLVLAAVFLKEPFTLRRWMAAALAVAGIVLVTAG